MVIPRCNTIDYLEDFLEAMGNIPEKDRMSLLGGFDVFEDAEVFMIDSVFLQETKKETPDWNRCILLLEKTSEFSQAWGGKGSCSGINQCDWCYLQ